MLKTFTTRAAQSVGVALFAALFAVFLIQIGARFAFNRPLPWTDELATVLYLWTVLWACIALLPLREHVAFDVLTQRLGRSASRWLRLTQALLLGGLCVWALPATWDYVNFMQRESTAVLGLSMRWVYAPFVLLLLAIAARCALQIWQTLRPESA